MSEKEKTAPHFVLTAGELQAISAHAQTRAFPRNAIILNEGDRTDSLYIILEGRVKAFVADPDGKEVVLSTQGAGEYFGEMVLDEGPRSASIMTLETSRFLVVPQSDFKEFLLKNPAVAVRVIEKLIHRVRALTESVKSLALMDVYGRVARLLMEMAETVDGQRVVVKKLPKQDIAKMIGASREMVSRVMKDLQLGGYIEVRGHSIVLRNSSLLAE